MPVGESSFDVVSQFNRQELVNAVDQALREVHTRYDLKDSGTTIELEASALKLHSASEMTLEAARDVHKERVVHHLAEDMADREASPRAQAASHDVRAVTGRLQRRLNAGPGRLADIAVRINHAGNGRRRHAGPARNLQHRPRACAHCGTVMPWHVQSSPH